MGVSQSGNYLSFPVTLQDYNTDPLFNGSVIRVFSRRVGMSFPATVGENTLPVGSQYYITGTSSDSFIGSARRNNIGYNSFTGFANANITVDCSWATDTGSYYSDGAGSLPILTPYKALVMMMSGRQFHLSDERIIRQMSMESNNSLYGSGIPVVIKEISFNEEKTSENVVYFTLTLREDR